MKTAILCLAGWLSVIVAAQPSPPFPKAAAHWGCTQEDAPAVEIYLTRQTSDSRTPSKPFIRIEIAGRDLTALFNKPIRLSPLRRSRTASNDPLARAEYNQNGNPPQWLSGTLTIRRVENDRVIEGSYDLMGPGGEMWSHTF